MLSVVTEVTVRGAHSSLSECSTRSMSTNRIASPGLSPVAVPSSQSDVVTALQSTGFVVTAGMAFQAIRAVSGAAVSKMAGGWSGGGTLCTRVPIGIVTGSGAPAASFSVKASGAEAETPGED